MRLRSTRAHIERRKSPCYKKSMNKKDELKSLLDDELLVRLSNVLQDSRRVESVLVAHIAELVPHLIDANCDELLARATHKSKREILVLLAEIAPKPDVPPTIRKVPERRNNNEQQASQKRRPDAAREARTSSGETTASGQSSPDPPTDAAPETPDKRAEVEPLSPAKRQQHSARLRRAQRLHGGDGLRQTKDGPVPTFSRPRP